MTFIPNPLANKLAEHEAAPAMKDAAEAAAAIARSIAPVLTGAYQASIRVEEVDGGAAVVAGGEGVDYAVFVEVGTSDTPAFHVLTRAAESAGLHLGGKS